MIVLTILINFDLPHIFFLRVCWIPLQPFLQVEAPTATARCRFETAAACCRAAKELKEVEGAAVQAFVLDGEARTRPFKTCAYNKKNNKFLTIKTCCFVEDELILALSEDFGLRGGW